MGSRFSGQVAYRRTRRMLAIAQPTVGAELTFTVPYGVLWELVSLVGTFTASAVVATRRPALQVSDGSTVGVRVPANTNATASQAIRYSWSQDVANVAVGTDGSTAIPHLILESGWIVSSSTLAIDVGDQWSGLASLVYETTWRGGAIDLDELGGAVVELVAAAAG